jgi:hypothetical protein
MTISYEAVYIQPEQSQRGRVSRFIQPYEGHDSLQSNRFHQKRNICPCCHLLILQYFVCHEKHRHQHKVTL